MKHGGALRHFCFVKNGVLQGCPLAALLFVVAMDRFVQMFHAAIDSLSLGVTCLCADDIAIVLKSTAQLVDLFRIFSLARRAAGLSLNVTKCVLVPLSQSITPHIISCLRDFLRAKTPEWANFSISQSAEYLGVWSGPQANVKHWIKPTPILFLELTSFLMLVFHLFWQLRHITLNAYQNIPT